MHYIIRNGLRTNWLGQNSRRYSYYLSHPDVVHTGRLTRPSRIAQGQNQIRLIASTSYLHSRLSHVEPEQEKPRAEHAVISTFDLFSIGVGPSSSHTVGPMRAGRIFVHDLKQYNLLEKVCKGLIDYWSFILHI